MNSSLSFALTICNLSSFQLASQWSTPMVYHYDYRILCVRSLKCHNCLSPYTGLRPFLALQLDWFQLGAANSTIESTNQVWPCFWCFARCVGLEMQPWQAYAWEQELFHIGGQPLEVENWWWDQGQGRGRWRWGWRRCSCFDSEQWVEKLL